MEINKLNLFSQIASTQGVGTSFKPKNIGSDPSTGGGSFSSGHNMFSGKTVGINDAITGTPVFAASQVGKKPGILGSSFQAIG